MPSTPDWLREKFHNKELPGDIYCARLLADNGWVQDRRFAWWSPLPISDVPQEHYHALLYLVYEWDEGYGGTIVDNTAPTLP